MVVATGLAAAEKDPWMVAERAAGGADVAGRLWATAARCRDKDPHLRRQCERVRESTLARNADAMVVVPVDAAAIQVGEWQAKTKSVPVTLRGCVACAEPVDLAGKPTFIVTRGAASREGKGVVGPTVAKAERSFEDEISAAEWRDAGATKLKAELLVRIPKAPIRVPGGLAVELVGFRLWDPCDGTLLAGSEGAKAGPLEEGACKSNAPSAERLGEEDVREALDPVRQDIQRCAWRFQTQGDGKIAVKVGKDGVIQTAEVRGDFAGTPAGNCVVNAVRKAKFREIKRDHQLIVIPFTFAR
jgi:hypothetical protein